MLSVADALRRVLPLFRRVGSEQVSLTAASGRVLSEPVVARLDLPTFDNSAMDGYAVRFAEMSVATTLPVSQIIAAGAREPSPLTEGSVARIFTGAPLPEGADTVVMQENAVATDDGVRMHTVPRRPGEHVRLRGSDIRRGEVLLSDGCEIGAGEVALLAAQGVTAVSVYRRPVVAVLSTGDELVEPARAGEPFVVVNSNAYMLAALIEECGAQALVLPTARDNLDEICSRVREALHSDVVLCSGGVSVGDFDLVNRAFDELGVVTEFHKVAIKPGKPLRVGSYGETVIIGLPGNPAGALVTFEVFVRPGLRTMAGHAALMRPRIRGRLLQAYPRKQGRTELARGRLRPDPEGGLPGIELHPTQGSGAFRSLTEVDVLAIFPPEADSPCAGDEVDALVLRPAALASAGGPLW